MGTALSGRLLAWNPRLTHALVPLLLGILTLSLLGTGHVPAWAIALLVLWGLVNSVMPVTWFELGDSSRARTNPRVLGPSRWQPFSLA